MQGSIIFQFSFQRKMEIYVFLKTKKGVEILKFRERSVNRRQKRLGFKCRSFVSRDRKKAGSQQCFHGSSKLPAKIYVDRQCLTGSFGSRVFT